LRSSQASQLRVRAPRAGGPAAMLAATAWPISRFLTACATAAATCAWSAAAAARRSWCVKSLHYRSTGRSRCARAAGSWPRRRG